MENWELGKPWPPSIEVMASRDNVTHAHNFLNSIIHKMVLYQDYTHEINVILHDKLQRESHKAYGIPASVTFLQLLRKQANTGTYTALMAETR